MGMLLEDIVNASRDFIALVNRDYVYEFVNASFRRELGQACEGILGKELASVWGEEAFRTRMKRGIDGCFRGEESRDLDRYLVGGDARHIEMSYYPYPSSGTVTHAMVYAQDVSLIKDLEGRLLDFEFRDATTGLFNRKSFDIVFDMELEKRRRAEGAELRVLMLVELAGMPEVNARHGAGVGDLVVETSGIRIRESLRASDYVFRWEGAVFASLLTSMKRPTDIPVVAEHLRTALARPYRRDGVDIRLDARIGVAIAPGDGEGREELVKAAFAALGESRRGDRGLALFDRELYGRAVERTRIKADIRKAIVGEEFELHYQPIVGPDRRLVGAEALIRWNHPSLGLVSPALFIPVAEETRDIKMIGRWVLFQVCARMRDWSPRHPGFYLSLNLSPSEFEDDDFLELLAGVVEKQGTIGPGAIKLEITETQGMKSVEDTVARMRGLAARGLDVLIDDFGSGWSSLAWLKSLPSRVIKVDKAFVDHVAEDAGDRDFLEGMVGMIRSRGKKVLVEGVEDERKFEILREIGCDMMQGYWFSRPLAAAEFERLLERGGTLPG